MGTGTETLMKGKVLNVEACLISWCSEGYVEHWPVLCDIDVLSAEHRLDLLLQLCLLSQLHQLVHSLLSHALTREVSQDLVVLLEEVVTASCIPQKILEMPAGS